MPDIENFSVEAKRGGATNDVDTQAQAATQLERLTPWQGPIALGPFALLIGAAQFSIAKSIPTDLFVVLICVAAFWAVIFKGYLLYLNYQK